MRGRRLSDSQDLDADLDLLDRRGGQRDPDRVADALREQRAERDRRLDRALERRAGLGDAEVQRPVAALGEQLVGAHHDDRVVVLDRDLEVVEVVLLEQRASHTRRLDERLGRGLAVLLEQPLVERAGVDADPDRDAGGPWRAAAISLTWSSNCRMLPGLTRTAAQPASIAAKTYFGWKWMSAITGICDLLGDRRQRLGVVLASGTATRTMSQPDAVSSAICCSVALTSEVSVVVIDCTETGASPPTPTLPTLIWRVWRRGASTGGGRGGHTEVDRRSWRHPSVRGRRGHAGWPAQLMLIGLDDVGVRSARTLMHRGAPRPST